MTSSAEASSEPAAGAPRSALAALAVGNFVIGTGVLIVVGLLEVMARDLGTSIPVTGQLLTVGALTVGVTAPLLAVLLSRIDRHRLLVISLVGYAVGHIACALAPNYAVLMLLRVLTLAGAAIFTPQAAAAAGAMAPGAGRAAAVASVFIGWSIASVAGAPLGTWLGTLLGWRAAMVAVALLSLVAAVLVHAKVPRNVSTPPLPLSTFGEVARHATLPRILLVTLVQATALFVLFAYIAPLVRAALGSVEPVSLVLAAIGLAGVVGNAWAVKLLPRWGAPRTVTTAIVSMAIGAALLPLGQGNTWIFCVLAAAWGLGSFATNSSQQARLATTAPALTPASVAMNTSAIYLGQAAGALLGGLLIADGLLVMVATSVVLYLVAAAVSRWVGDHRGAR